MSINPYQAPASNLTPPVQAVTQRPLTINLACGLFGLSLLAGCADFIPGYGTDWEVGSTYMVYGMIAGAFILTVLSIGLIYAIFKGKNWARWTMLGLSVLGVLMLFLPNEEPTPSQLVRIIDIISTLSYLPGCALLFFGKGGRWFAEGKRRA